EGFLAPAPHPARKLATLSPPGGGGARTPPPPPPAPAGHEPCSVRPPHRVGGLPPPLLARFQRQRPEQLVAAVDRVHPLLPQRRLRRPLRLHQLAREPPADRHRHRLLAVVGDRQLALDRRLAVLPAAHPHLAPPAAVLV